MKQYLNKVRQYVGNVTEEQLNDLILTTPTGAVPFSPQVPVDSIIGARWKTALDEEFAEGNRSALGKAENADTPANRENDLDEVEGDSEQEVEGDFEQEIEGDSEQEIEGDSEQEETDTVTA